MPYLVGDGGGPEIFVPSQNGRVLSNSDSKDALGGGAPINVTVAISQEQIAGIAQVTVEQNNRVLYQQVKSGRGNQR
jgi:hypothetical protein